MVILEQFLCSISFVEQDKFGCLPSNDNQFILFGSEDKTVR